MSRSFLACLLASTILTFAGPASAQSFEDEDDEPAPAATPQPAQEPAASTEVPPPPGEGAPARRGERSRRRVEEVPPPPTGYAGLESPYGGAAVGVMATIPSGVQQRLRLLDGDIAALAQSDGSMQLANDIIRLVAGAVLVAAGFLVYDDDPAAVEERALASILWASGGFGVVGGTLGLILTPRPSSAAIAYQHMPMRNRTEVRDRLRFGEHLLERTADRSRVSRIVDGSLSIVSAGVMMGLFLDLRGGFSTDDFYTWLVIAATATGVISGIVTLVSPTLAERRWSAYREARDRLRRSRRRGSVDGALVPLPGGGVLGSLSTVL